jgi:calcineurin-like phosphoesterase family protein
MNWYVSDTHFSHFRIIGYCNRPFNSVMSMDNNLIENINNKVGVSDTLYHLGDFCFGQKRNVVENYNRVKTLRDRINCRNVILIYGNHDKEIRKNRDLQRLFQGCHDYLEIYDGSQNIVLFHYAMRVWNKSHHGAWHLYGHSHYSLPDDPNALSMDIGVDNPACHYGPLCFADIKLIMDKKNYRPVDHHAE